MAVDPSLLIHDGDDGAAMADKFNRGLGYVEQAGSVVAADKGAAAESAQHAAEAAQSAQQIALGVSTGHPAVRPTLSLYLTRPALDPRLTYSRGSPGTYRDITGKRRTAPVNVWPLDSWGVVGGRYADAATTNVYTRSEEMTGTSTVTVQPNSAIAPDGTLTADIVTDSPVADEHFSADRYADLIAGTQYTFSAFVRRMPSSNLRAYLRLAGGGIPGVSAQFDLTAMTAHLVSSGASARIDPDWGGWYRVQLTFVAAGSVNRILRLQHATPDGQTIYPGDGVSSIAWWGGQFEVGATASPYIPTGPTAATRAASDASLPIGDWYNPQEGTWFIDVDREALPTTDQVMLCVGNPASGFGGGQFYVRQSASGVTASTTGASGLVSRSLATLRNRVAVSHDASGSAIAVNGIAGTSGPAAVPPTAPTNVQVLAARWAATPTAHWGGRGRRLVYWPKKFAMAHLQALTS